MPRRARRRASVATFSRGFFFRRAMPGIISQRWRAASPRVISDAQAYPSIARRPSEPQNANGPASADRGARRANPIVKPQNVSFSAN
jgi:hypothetical protein